MALAAVVVHASGRASAHLGRDDGFTLAPGQDPVLDALSMASLAVVSAAGLAYLGRRAVRGDAPGATWMLAGFGVAWVATPTLVPSSVTFEPWWTLVATVLVFGTIASAWVVILRTAGPAWASVRARGRLLATAVVASAAFLLLLAFGTHMVIIPEPHQAGLAGGTGFIVAYETFGPLAVWPDLEFWWPEAGLGGHVTPASAAIALSLAAFFGLAVSVVVASFVGSSVGSMAGSGGAALATNLCACCTPALYPVLVALFGSGAAPLVYAMGDADLPLYNAVQVANLWLMTTAVVLATRPWRAEACDVPAGAAASLEPAA